MGKVLVGILGLALCLACGTDEDVASSNVQSATNNSTNPSSVHSIGGINASLNGEAIGWHVTGEQSGDSWLSRSDVNNAGGFSIFGHATYDTTTSDVDGLRIGVTVREIGSELQASNIEITFLKGGTGEGSYSSANDGHAEMEITNMSKEDGLTRLVGNFSATLPYKKYASREVETDKVVVIKRGRFNVRIPPLRR